MVVRSPPSPVDPLLLGLVAVLDRPPDQDEQHGDRDLEDEHHPDEHRHAAHARSSRPLMPGMESTIPAMADAGLFGPETMTWRVNREGVLLLGGGRALILQVAHPLVAAGVAEHSNYRDDPWGRLYRTLDLTTKIVFGSTHTAEEAAARIRHVHKRVHGVTREAGGPSPPRAPPAPRGPE